MQSNEPYTEPVFELAFDFSTFLGITFDNQFFDRSRKQNRNQLSELKKVLVSVEACEKIIKNSIAAYQYQSKESKIL